jgi:hypothetical protein
MDTFIRFFLELFVENKLQKSCARHNDFSPAAPKCDEIMLRVAAGQALHLPGD